MSHLVDLAPLLVEAHPLGVLLTPLGLPFLWRGEGEEGERVGVGVVKLCVHIWR